MSSLARLLSRVASVVSLGLLLAVVFPASAQSNTPTLNFGSVSVGLTSTQVVTANTGNVMFSLAAGADYTISTTTCVPDPNIGYDCTATVTFTPKYPGQFVDAVLAPNSDGFAEPIAFLTGTGTSPQLGFFYGSAATYSPTVNNPVSVAVAPDGSFYTSSLGDNTVYRYDSNGGNRTTIDFSGFGNVTPGALAVDGAGTLYLADPVENRVYTYSRNRFGIFADATQVSHPVGLAVDAAYTLYIADAGNNRVISIDANDTLTVLASNLNNLVGVALDSSGNLYYAQAGTINSVFEIPAGGGNTITVGQSNFGTIQGLAVDAGGAVYLATSGGVVLLSHNLTTGFGFGSGGPAGVAVDPQGNIYEAQVPVDGSSGDIGILLRNTGTATISAMVGQSGGQQILIENTGNTPLSFASFAFSNSAFAVNPEGTSCSTTAPLPAGNLCSLQVIFSPTAPQTYNGTLTVTSNSLNRTANTNQYTLIGQTPTSTTSFTVTPNPSAAGQSVTFTATVSAYLGTSLTPTGTVDFINVNNSNAVLGSGTLTTVPGAGQQATFTATTLPAGSYNVRARYNGSATIAGGLSAPTTVVVNGLPTTTTLAVSASTIAHGQPETLTATIAAGATPAISGTIEFLAGSNVLATVPVTATSTGGTATYTTSTLGVGTQSLTAFYSGDTNYAAGGSTAQQVIVQGASPTSLSLVASSATVPYRSPVTLTATALNSSNAPLTTGQVFFCDLSVAICNPTYNLGTAQLNSAGVAVLRLAPGAIGDHQFVASLISTNTTSNATANATVTVTGTYPTSATLASSGTVGNYMLTGTVIGAGSRLPGPAGTATFQDLTNTSNPTLGTATLGASTVAFTIAQPSGSPLAVGNGPYGVATGDFDGNGFPDIVTENYSAGTVSVLLGNGDGTFKPQVTYAVGSLPERVLVADFNGDGYADLVVANTGSSSVSILLGNGDGTFRPQVTYAAGSPVGLGVMDLNNDGIADLAVGDYYGGTFSVLLGIGDGTFQPAVTYATGSTPQTLAEGDFNGDGFVDVVVGNLDSNTVSVFLNKGDGTFNPQVTYPVGSKPQGVQVGNFDSDHFADLAVSNSTDGTISILLGNGDGTFKPQVTYPVGVDPVGLVVADFNGDGIQDLSTGNTGNIGTTTNPAFVQSILLGNGDGTFQPQTTYNTGNFPYGEAVADFDGDGYPDLVISNFSDKTATIFLSQVTATSTLSLTGVAVAAPAGQHNVDLSYPATGTFAASVSPTIQLTSGETTAASSATTLSIAPAAATVGQSVTFSVAVTGATQTAPIPTGTVTLTSTGGNLGTTTITLGTTGTGSFSTTQIPAGAYTVTATYSGDANYAASTSSPQSLSITSSTVSMGATSTVANGGVAPGSPLDYTFFGNTRTENELPPGGQPTVLTDFTVNVLSNVEYPGNGNYTRITAPGGTSAFTTGTVTDNPTNYPSTTPHTTLLATFSPLKAGSFSVNILDGNTDGIYVGNSSVGLGVNGAPPVVTASQHLSGTNEFTTYTILNASPSDVFQVYATTSTNSYPSIGGLTFTVGVPMSTTTSLAVSAAKITPGQSDTLTATIAGITSPAETGLVTFSDQSALLGTAPVTATGTGGTASFTLTTLSTGTHQITAAYSGDANNIASVSAAQTVVVAQTTQTITFPPIPSHAVNDQPFTLAATASSNLPVSYAVVSGPAAISGSTVTLTGATGTVVIRASQPGNTTYAAATSVTQSFTVSLATQTIAFPAIPSHTIEDAPFTLAATASSSLAVSYTLVSGPATVAGNTVTLTGTTGTVVIQASQPGNTIYAAAASVSQSFTVSAAPIPTLTAVTPSAIVTGSAATTITLTGANFNAVDVLKLNGSVTIATTFVSATTLTAVIPATALASAGTLQVAVNDLIGKTTSNALAITVSSTPAVVFSGPTTPPASGQQPTLTFKLTNPYPVPLTASFNLLFAPAVTPAVDDPAIQFANGGRNYTFTIAANSVTTPSIQLQAGTEAGTITVPVTLTAQGVDVTPAGLAPVVIVIPPTAPVVNLVTMNSTNGALNVVVTGYSNTREATQAHFHFTAAPGAELNTPDFTANINPLFTTWYGSTASDPYGSTVVYTQTFTLDSGTASTITGVAVTLTNSVGTSNTGSSQ